MADSDAALPSERALALADHIEGDHEREVPGPHTERELATMHTEMHRRRDDWDHTHRS